MRSFLVLAFCLAALVPAQTRETQVDTGFDDMYNLRFAEAHTAFGEWGKAHPDDPRTPVFQAAADLFDLFDRLHILESEFVTNDDNFLFPQKLPVDTGVRDRMLARFAETKKMADAGLTRNPNDARALMALVLRAGLYADYLALIQKQDTAALAEIKQGTVWAQRLLQVRPDDYDAYLASGVENYLLSQKAAPVRWLLRLGGAQTDRDKGLHDLRIVAEKGHYLQPYAQLMLAIAALRANENQRARELLHGLSQRFPENPLYKKEMEKIPG